MSDSKKVRVEMQSFIPVSAESHFPIQNLPYGVFKTSASPQPRVGVAIGEFVLDLAVITDAGLLPAHVTSTKCFQKTTLNCFMKQGKAIWTETRAAIQKLLSADNAALRDNKALREKALINMKDVEMVMPVDIGDYTDFYASKQHATNIGTMFRGKDNALMPNWKHIPIGYHGRASSVVLSGTPLHRPNGQRKPPDADPVFGPCKILDYEIEMGWFVGTGNDLGKPLSIKTVRDHIFGMVVVNDWSARDIQKWEYVPLGPFGAKNFGTTISPWVVPYAALEPYFGFGEVQDPKPLPYLQDAQPGNLDVKLQCHITDKKGNKELTSTTSFTNMYWSIMQQTVHHSITGCNMRSGDMLASGTISGETPDSYGSLLEKTWGGKNKWKLAGEERTYIEDGDTVTMTGYVQGEGFRIGFGECSGTILPAVQID